MLAEERRQLVLDLVSQRGFVALTDLTRSVEASESTIRRDLDYWDQQGVLKRAHGGAIYLGDAVQLPAFEDRTTHQLREKQEIASAVVSRIRDGEAILLDGGTTTYEIARLLIGRPVQVVTNSLPIAQLLASCYETDLVMLGGYVYPKTGVALGPLSIRMMQDLHVHQSILSVSGITRQGLHNGNLLLVETQRQMMTCADEVVVVADHTKIGKSALAFLCDFKEIDTLVVDSALNDDQRTWLEQCEVRLFIAGTPEEFNHEHDGNSRSGNGQSPGS